jgi:hypothetical protein
MQLLFQRSLRSNTRISQSDKIVAEAVLLSSDTEMVARLVAAADTFLIEQAKWEILRQGAAYAPQSATVPALLGVEAYFGIAPALLRAFPDKSLDVQRDLFVECIKAILQSETYLYTKRGFIDGQAYQDNWDISHPNSCRYYSHLDIVENRWLDHIGLEPRASNIFHRHKNIAVWQISPEIIQATGSFLDSFHEIGVAIACEKTGRIVSFEGKFLRAPDKLCFGTATLGENLVGKNVRELSRGEMNRCVGGAEGCAHLLDIGRDTVSELHNAMNSFDDICA